MYIPSEYEKFNGRFEQRRMSENKLIVQLKVHVYVEISVVSRKQKTLATS